VVIGFLNSAKRTIHASIYVFSGSPYILRNAIENAAERGVKVQISVDSTDQKITDEDYDLLKTMASIPNVEVKRVNLGTGSAYHSKVVIVDGEKAYVGSANWSAASMESRREIGLAFEDATLVSALETIFFRDWNSSYARWIVEPNTIFAFITNALIVFVMLLAAVAAVLHVRRRKSRRVRKEWVSELWASPRQEV
jgi:phosphatidylserine/phosphatidylglycerophosphate/cardiolipin synthase-like enzyme